MNILQYESSIWSTADLLRGSGIKESEWPSFMMPFFALVMVESRLVRMLDEEKTLIGEEVFLNMDKNDRYEIIKDKGQGYNTYIIEHNKTLADICRNDKSFDVDFTAYLSGFDGETKDLLGVDAVEGEKFLDIKGVISKLKAKKVLFGYTKLWSEIDLKEFNNSEITTLEEHIKRKWADISAETAGEQYTPDDIIALISEIIASKIEESDQLLKIYDCTCGGGNLLFGVEDRINEKFRRFTQTFGQDWNDALFALAKIESRFRADSKIEHGNTLVDDKFYNEEFDVVIANPPYGVSWKGYEKDIRNDKTERFKHIPSISDGQLLFMQHLISKMDSNDGIGVVVHNGSTLFSGDAGSAESNIRKWMLDKDIVEAVIQLPTDEFFNTGIYTYLWVLNKNKSIDKKDKVMLINASEKYTQLKKNKGAKRKEIDALNRRDIVNTLIKFTDNDYAKVFDKENFYYNKQAIMLTNIDANGIYFKSNNKDGKINQILHPIKVSSSEIEITMFEIREFDESIYSNLYEAYERYYKPLIAGLDYKDRSLIVTTKTCEYRYNDDKDTIEKKTMDTIEELGCGKILFSTLFKKANKTKSEHIIISVELTPDYQKDYEIIQFHKDNSKNIEGIEKYMNEYISKPFELLENTVGVEISFNKIFYKPEMLRTVSEILDDISIIDLALKQLEQELGI